MKQYLTGGEGRGCPWWASSHGGPRLWGIKGRGGERGGDEWKYQKRGGGVALSLAFPMFWFPGVERGGVVCPSCFLARAVCVLDGMGRL